jgi:hypothetical protein
MFKAVAVIFLVFIASSAAFFASGKVILLGVKPLPTHSVQL